MPWYRPRKELGGFLELGDWFSSNRSTTYVVKYMTAKINIQTNEGETQSS